ncbi:hypothetical protein T06_12562 [Trichinella sp. T6]|nr:hypothetical protein T06_12562 [Trichinella sp. T6]
MPVTVQFSTSFHKLIICYSEVLQQLVATDRKCVVNNRAVCDSMKSDDLGKPQERDASPRFPFFWNEFYRGFVVYCLPSADHLEAPFHLFLGSCYRKTAGKALEKDYRIIFIFDIFGFLLTISDASPPSIGLQCSSNISFLISCQ